MTLPNGYRLAENNILITLGDVYEYFVYVVKEQNPVTKKTGFQHEDGGTVYYNQSGNRLIGEQVIDGHTYYFNPKANGLMATGIAEEKMGDPYYLFNDQGQKQGAGEHLYHGKWYYCDPNNNDAVATGFTKLPDGRTVYYSLDDGMVHGKQIIDGRPYNFANGDGHLEPGWTNNDGKYYYVNDDGSVANGEQCINGYWYYFNPTQSDAMTVGFCTLPDGRRVYYDQHGHMTHGEYKINNEWYYFAYNVAMATGFTKLPTGKLVYYNDQGQMVYGPLTHSNNHYYFDTHDGHMITGLFFNRDLKGFQFYGSNGQRQTGEVYIEGEKLNFTGPNDTLVSQGEQKIASKWYLFSSDGKLVTGFATLPDKREVYYDPDNSQMMHGERQIGNDWFFFDYTDGHEYQNAFAHLNDGRTTYYDGNGHMNYGEKNINGYWYHFNETNGAMTRGFYSSINNDKIVYYDNNGRMVHGWTTINGNRYDFDSTTGALDLNTTLITLWQSIINNYSNPISIAIQAKRDGHVYSYTNRPGHRWRMASTVKVSVLAQLLHNTGGSLNGYQQQLATNMIRNSDNNATQTIVSSYLGGDWNLKYIFSALGMNRTAASWHWGSSTTTAVDQLKVLQEIYMSSGNGYLNQHARDYIAGLMHSINPNQRWGISAGSSNYYVKDGWVPDPATNWCVNSIGYIPRNGNNGYTIAVYSDYNVSMQGGISIVERIARATAKIMPWL